MCRVHLDFSRPSACYRFSGAMSFRGTAALDATNLSELVDIYLALPLGCSDYATLPNRSDVRIYVYGVHMCSK
jgi:hypothetical protein